VFATIDLDCTTRPADGSKYYKKPKFVNGVFTDAPTIMESYCPSTELEKVVGKR